jgi:hypothetical protein
MTEFRAPQQVISKMLKNCQVIKKYYEAYRFIYSSWNDTMNSSESTASNGTIISELSYASP